MVVYEDDEVRVIWHPGQTDYMLITFADMDGLATNAQSPSFAQTPVLKGRISSIGFVAKRGNWYVHPGMTDAIDAVAALLAPYASRILYGGSMGGYAAIKHSRVLGATETIALCPQWSIDLAECEGMDPGHANCRRPYMAAMGIREADVAGRIFTFFDPQHKLDRWHAARIERNAGGHAIGIPVPVSDHHVTAIFRGSANLAQLIEACRFGTPDAVRILVNGWRRHSPLSLDILLQRAAGRHPMLAMRAAACPRAALSRFATSGEQFHFPVARTLLERGQFAEVAAHLERVAPSLLLEERLRADVMREAIETGVIGNRQSIVMTHYGTLLVYDVLRGELRHVPWAEYAAHKFAYSPVLVRLGEGILGLHVFLKGAMLLLRVEQSGRARIVLDQAERSAVEFALEPVVVDQGVYTFRRNGLFMCAEPTSQVTVSRRVAAKWEEFRLVLA